MGKGIIKEFNSLSEVAKEIKNNNKDLSLLYAFNGTGKTRLSMEFRDLVNENREWDKRKIIYYNAYTEDLFTWDNDLKNNNEKKLKINKNSTFLDLIKKYGKENEVATKFKELTSSKIEPNIDVETGIVTFNLPTGDSETIENIKISRGEESIFIWTMFYILMETVISELNIDEEIDRTTNEFDEIKYIYIDDPISSLDDNHIIELAVNLRELINSSKNDNLKFIISTHHALFYNILFNEFGKKKKIIYYSLKSDQYKNSYALKNEFEDSDFSYHLAIKKEIEEAINKNRIEKYHFMLFRNLLEKTASYLGYNNWGNLIIGEKVNENNRENYIRMINRYSHSKISEPEYVELREREKNTLKLLFNNFIKEFKWEGHDSE